jgi:uncharacterized protein (AIM24 family)
MTLENTTEDSRKSNACDTKRIPFIQSLQIHIYLMSKNNDPDKVLHAAGWDQITHLIPKPTDTFFAITGNESQVLTVRLKAGDRIRGEPGTMMYLTDGVRQSVACNQCLGRCCTGEDCCVLNFVNHKSADAYASLTPNFPTAKIVPVNLQDCGGSLICQKGALLASYGPVTVSMCLDCNFMRCCCGGFGLVRQRLEGSGTVFLNSTGTMVQKILQPGETILIDTECALAYAATCKLSIRRAGGILGIIGGGEGKTCGVTMSTLCACSCRFPCCACAYYSIAHV